MYLAGKELIMRTALSKLSKRELIDLIIYEQNRINELELLLHDKRCRNCDVYLDKRKLIDHQNRDNQNEQS